MLNTPKQDRLLSLTYIFHAYELLKCVIQSTSLSYKIDVIARDLRLFITTIERLWVMNFSEMCYLTMGTNMSQLAVWITCLKEYRQLLDMNNGKWTIPVARLISIGLMLVGCSGTTCLLAAWTIIIGVISVHSHILLHSTMTV